MRKKRSYLLTPSSTVFSISHQERISQRLFNFHSKETTHLWGSSAFPFGSTQRNSQSMATIYSISTEMSVTHQPQHSNQHFHPFEHTSVLLAKCCFSHSCECNSNWSDSLQSRGGGIFCMKTHWGFGHWSSVTHPHLLLKQNQCGWKVVVKRFRHGSV